MKYNTNERIVFQTFLNQVGCKVNILFEKNDSNKTFCISIEENFSSHKNIRLTLQRNDGETVPKILQSGYKRIEVLPFGSYTLLLLDKKNKREKISFIIDEKGVRNIDSKNAVLKT